MKKLFGLALTLALTLSFAGGALASGEASGGGGAMLPSGGSFGDVKTGSVNNAVILINGDEIEVTGPFGNGFPLEDADIVLIGGGVGVAPLYYLAKAHRAAYPDRKITVHLGFREKAMLTEEYSAVCDELILNIGGFVTDDVDYTMDATYYACGPTPMMNAAAVKAREANAKLYVSLENRMACGAGACLCCTCKTKSGNKRACKDGPVFPAEEVFYE